MISSDLKQEWNWLSSSSIVKKSFPTNLTAPIECLNIYKRIWQFSIWLVIFKYLLVTTRNISQLVGNSIIKQNIFIGKTNICRPTPVTTFRTCLRTTTLTSCGIIIMTPDYEGTNEPFYGRPRVIPNIVVFLIHS